MGLKSAILVVTENKENSTIELQLYKDLAVFMGKNPGYSKGSINHDICRQKREHKSGAVTLLRLPVITHNDDIVENTREIPAP